jgi:hypothetical protein
MDFITWLRGQWDRVSAGLAMVAGAVCLTAGWFGISDELHPAGQLPYLVSGGLGGLFLLGVGATLWLSADLRDEWRELRRVRGLLERATTATISGGVTDSAAPVDRSPQPVDEAAPQTNGRRPKVAAR